ncbi:MAG: DUF1598 domain-containing protein, partial [Planctomycetes bacterium]|nr:DUF1598 domain-containing protein [Planctomycetota bacterium]
MQRKHGGGESVIRGWSTEGEGPERERKPGFFRGNRVCRFERSRLASRPLSVGPRRIATRVSMNRFRTAMVAFLIAVGWLAAASRTAVAQPGFGFGAQAVGGIAVDAQGIVRNLDPRAREELAVERRRILGDEAGAACELRKISLAKVIAALKESAAKKAALPAEVLFLGGLERITHVFVDPDGHDIVLAGPADRITVDAGGAIVGAKSRRPLLQLEDLIVALRAIDKAREGGMLCSIDPTAEGRKKLQAFLARQETIVDPARTFRSMEEAVGPQVVTVGGVPGDTRFAQVLVAADYRMKRIGMGLEESGLPALPSYLSMVPAGGRAVSLPRFWLEADYDPIARDADELAWRIGGRRMKCLTETDVAGRAGLNRGAGGQDKIAARWCEAMTRQYDALATRQPVFADLVNCVDLAVVAAIIRSRQLDGRAGLDLGLLLDAERLPLPKYDVAASVPTVASGLKKGRAWVLSA